MRTIRKVRLSEIAELITKGTTPTTLGYDFQDNGVNFLKIECFSENGDFIKEKVAHISEKCHERLKRSQLRAGDVLFSIAGAIGRVAIVTKKMLPANTNQALAIIRIARDDIYLPYVKLILKSPIVKTQFERKKQGVAQLNISLKDITELEIPLPDMDQQIECAELFKKISEIIDFRQQELQKLDEFVKSRFIELFTDKGYPIRTINEVSLDKGEYGAQSASTKYNPKRPRYVRITDINDDGTLNDDMVASINLDDDEQYRLEYGDFMFARMGATVGKTYTFISGNQIFAGYLIRYKLNLKLINPRYLFWYTKLDEYWNWVKLNQSGAAQPGINAQKYDALRIPVPPIELQEQFAAFVEQVDKSKIAVQQALDKAQLLFDSLMQKYFGYR